MPDDAQLTTAMRQAFEIARADASVQIIDALTLCPNGAAEFRCKLPVQPFPNPEGIPEHTTMRVRLHSAFPYHDIDIFAEDKEVRGFPHQDAETHKLCLYQERDAPWNPSRLKFYLDWARDWLADAANGNLLRPGQPYELPDFSRRNLREQMPTQLPVLFDETAQSYSSWQPYIGTAGDVELLPATTLRGLLPRRFYAADGALVREWIYPDDLAEVKKRISGTWILLPSLIYRRHRPPQTFGELSEMCRNNGVDLLGITRSAWEQRNKDPEVACLLVGYPIPRRVGEEPFEVHWQPLFIRSYWTEHRERKKQKNHERSNFTVGGIWNAMMNEHALEGATNLPWGRSENIARERLYARGEHRGISARKKIVIAGCGALGSVVAELAIRGGAHDVCLLDKDLFEMGNECRHTLDGRNLREGKATALATRLQSANPLSNVTGFIVTLPPAHADKDREKVIAALDDADLIIDCTAHQGAFRWLDQISRRTHARLATIYVNFRATILTLGISGRTTSCGRVCRRLYADIDNGKAPVSKDEHGAAPEPEDLVLPGAGCWHPTFPAVNADMWMMASAAINAINQLLAEPLKTEGTAVLFRRSEDALVKPLDVVWVRKYR